MDDTRDAAYDPGLTRPRTNPDFEPAGGGEFQDVEAGRKYILNRLRERRERLKLSTRALAEKPPPSWKRNHSHLAQVENDALGLNALGLWAMSYALYDGPEPFEENPATHFLPPEQRWSVRTLDECKEIDRPVAIDAARTSVLDITPRFPENIYRIALLTVQGRAKSNGLIPPHFHHGEEFLFLLSGEIEVQVCTPFSSLDTAPWTKLSAKDQDYVWFPAHLPHRYRKPNDDELGAVFVSVDPAPTRSST